MLSLAGKNRHILEYGELLARSLILCWFLESPPSASGPSSRSFGAFSRYLRDCLDGTGVLGSSVCPAPVPGTRRVAGTGEPKEERTLIKGDGVLSPLVPDCCDSCVIWYCLLSASAIWARIFGCSGLAGKSGRDSLVRCRRVLTRLTYGAHFRPSLQSTSRLSVCILGNHSGSG